MVVSKLTISGAGAVGVGRGAVAQGLFQPAGAVGLEIGLTLGKPMGARMVGKAVGLPVLG